MRGAFGCFLEPRARAEPRAPRRGRDAGATRDTVPETSRRMPSPATPRLGSRSRAFPRVVSRVSCQRDNPSRSRDPRHPRVDETGSVRVSTPARGPRAARREGLARCPRHDETRLDSRAPPKRGETRSDSPSARRSPVTLDPSALATPSSRPPSLFFPFRTAAPRWTAPAACASWTSTTSPRP